MRTGADFLDDEDEKATDEAVDGDGPGDGTARVELIRGDTMTPVPIDWVWRGYLARGKLELIAGAPESGKTTIALDFAATMTRGGTWPDGSRALIGDVLIWSGEDDWTDTLLPRLIACGADLTRVYNIAAVVDEHENKLPFNPARDIPALLNAAKKHPELAMMIIDPVVSAITGDGHKNAEVRRGLQPISAMAEVLKIVVLGITHFTKGTSGRDPIERVTGSLAFGAAARLVMVTVSPKEQGEKRCLIRGKSNIGPSGGGYKYELARKALPEHGIAEAQWVHWAEPVEGNARELLDAAEGVEQPAKRDMLGIAKAWLRDTLRNGPVEQKTIQCRARTDGMAWGTVRRAKDALGVMALKDAGGGPWRWYPAAPEARG